METQRAPAYQQAGGVKQKFSVLPRVPNVFVVHINNAFKQLRQTYESPAELFLIIANPDFASDWDLIIAPE